MPHSREARHKPYGPAFHKMTRELTRSVNRINRRQNISYEFVFLAMPRETLPARLCTSFGVDCDGPDGLRHFAHYLLQLADVSEADGTRNRPWPTGLVSVTTLAPHER
jgi:hypothetical protein